MKVQDKTSEMIFVSSVLGVSCEIAVRCLIHPLDVVKVQQQSSERKVVQIVYDIFKLDGLLGFFRGLKPQLIKAATKRFWYWPIITTTPKYLEGYSLSDLQKQAIIGFGISSFDAIVSTPLERAKVLSILCKTPERGSLRGVSFKSNILSFYNGFFFNWSRLMLCWVSFLVAQKFLRQRVCDVKGQPSLTDLLKIGVQVGVFVSFATAIFDLATTLKLSNSFHAKEFFSSKKIFLAYRSWPLSATSLIIRNISSVILIDRGLGC